MKKLSDLSLGETFQDEIFLCPAVSIRVEDTLADAIILLPHHLETLTDSLVVTNNEKPVGVIGGIEVLDNILKNSSGRYLDETRVGEVMSKDLFITDPRDGFSNLISRWMKTHRAFAIVPNQYKGYSVISARKFLSIGEKLDIETPISKIPTKKTIIFSSDDTMKQIIERMFNFKTRKLVLSGTSQFINDRIIIQKIARELDCLRNNVDFLGMKPDISTLEQAKTVPCDIPIGQACKIMNGMKSPYLITEDRVISPWDIVIALFFDTT